LTNTKHSTIIGNICETCTSHWIIETPRWQRITRLSEAAEASGQNDLALAVFETSPSPGWHEKYLGEQCEKIKLRLQAQS